MIRKLVFLFVLVAFAFGAMFVPVSAAGNDASVYVVHGIPGKDIGLDPALPVDVKVGDACALQGFKFGEIAGPVSLPAGSYMIAISLANASAPCSNDPVIAAEVPFAAGENASVVAHLTAAGAITASKFVNDLKPAHPGMARVIVQHTAAAPEVDIKLQYGKKWSSLSKMLSNVPNGAQANLDLLPGRWSGTISPAGSSDVVYGPQSMRLRPFTAYLVYAVGSLNNETFTFLTKSIDLPRKWR